jgi:transcriptional regulator with XRE-family HTH domain
MSLSSISNRRGAGAISPEDRQALGRSIRHRRVEQGLTQSQLASPLTRAYASAVEHGRVTPSLASLVLFAQRLGVTVGELVAPLEHRRADDTTEGFTST